MAKKHVILLRTLCTHECCSMLFVCTFFRISKRKKNNLRLIQNNFSLKSDIFRLT